MTITSLLAGNTVVANVTFTPAAGGTVSLGDVTAWTITASGVVTALTGIAAGVYNITTGAVTATPNTFYVFFQVPDAAKSETWRVRWESNLPSPHIVCEDGTSKFPVVASASSTP